MHIYINKFSAWGDSPIGLRKEEERPNNGDNNGQATHGARKHAWRTQAAWAKKRERPKVGNNNGQLRIATPPWVAHAKPPGPKIFYPSGKQ